MSKMYEELEEAITRLASRAKLEPSGKQAAQLSIAAKELAMARDTAMYSDGRALAESFQYPEANPKPKNPLGVVTSIVKVPTYCHICDQKLQGVKGLDNLHCPDADPSEWMDKLHSEEPTYCVQEET